MRYIVILLSVLSLLFLNSFRKGTYQNQNYFLDTLKNDTLNIDTVGITKILSAEQRYEVRKKEYRSIYMWGDNKKAIKINPYGGVLININKVYSHFSKIGKNSRRLQRVFEKDYNIERTEAIWKPLTVKLTDLKGDSLFYFQMYFLPDPGFLESASYYEKVEYVVKSMRIYKDSAAFIHDRMKLPKWKDIKD